ncbi:CDP-diacylglycerol--serine O-phosphatidyltransferase [Candidatus Cloacimonadota bacterium]
MKFKYLVPNFFTACSLVSGIFALKYAFQADYNISGWLIAVSIVCDGLDGKLARVLDAASNFGRYFDTISDFFAFGIVPAVLAYVTVLHNYKIVGVIITMIYTVCGALRLTRFMRKSTNAKEKNPFTGLPIPAAAGIVSSFLIFNYTLWQGLRSPLLFALIMLFSAFLMISKIKYVSFDIKILNHNFMLIILFIIGLALSIFYPHYIYFLSFLIYILHGLIINFHPVE